MAARRNRRRRRRNRGRSGFLYKLMSALIICAAILAGCIVFFRVDVVVVDGNVRYTSEEIIGVAGVERGDNLFSLNKFNMQKNIRRELPYVSEVQIIRRLPDTLLITVSESAAVAAIQKDGEWWLLDAQCKLLERGDAALAQGRAEVRGISPLAPDVGTQLAVAQEERAKLDSLSQLLSALYRQGMDGQLTDFIDLTAANEIRFGFGEKLTVVVPMNADFPAKIFALRRVQETYEEQMVELTGTLDLTYGESEAHVLPHRWTPDDGAAVPAQTPTPEGEPNDGEDA